MPRLVRTVMSSELEGYGCESRFACSLPRQGMGRGALGKPGRCASAPWAAVAVKSVAFSQPLNNLVSLSLAHEVIAPTQFPLPDAQAVQDHAAVRLPGGFGPAIAP